MSHLKNHTYIHIHMFVQLTIIYGGLQLDHMSEYTYIYVPLYIYIYAHECTFSSPRASTSCIETCNWITCQNTQTYICSYTYTYTHMNAHSGSPRASTSCMETHNRVICKAKACWGDIRPAPVSVCILYVYMYVCICIYMYIYIMWFMCEAKGVLRWHTTSSCHGMYLICVYVCMYVYVYICIYMFYVIYVWS